MIINKYWNWIDPMRFPLLFFMKKYQLDIEIIYKWVSRAYNINMSFRQKGHVWKVEKFALRVSSRRPNFTDAKGYHLFWKLFNRKEWLYICTFISR